MLETLQSIDETVLISSITGMDKEQTIISSPNLIPDTASKILQYFDNPRMNNNEKLVLRIFLTAKPSIINTVDKQTIKIKAKIKQI
jgi:hypothetical protein